MKDNFNLDKLKPKKRVNSHKKGGNFTLKITKILNERFNTKEFSKTPTSGAYATTHNLPEHLKIYGDIIVPKGFRFCIECKKGYNKESLYSLLDKQSDVWSWIYQNERDAVKSSMDSLLIIQQDRKPIIVVLEADLIKNLAEDEPKIFFGKYVILGLDCLLSLNYEFFFKDQVDG